MYVIMDHFHKLLDLVDKNANTIPEGDYIEICNIIKYIHEKVKPPPFLLNQNEPMTFYQIPYEDTLLSDRDTNAMRERDWFKPKV